jgi:dTDP-4-amino-4,6-dideoxygalactose transaminase
MGSKSESIRGNAGKVATINLFWPYIPRQDWLKGLNGIFKGKWIGQGPAVDEFERPFRWKFQYPYALAVNSGTAALELAYDLVGIGPGDVVLTPVLTCTATNIPLIRRGATLEFVDVDPITWNMSREDFKKKIHHGVKAVVMTNLGGIPGNYEILEEARRWGVPTIVDAAQSLGIRQAVGTFICYSFQAIKHFTTGDGGMLVCAKQADHERAKRLRWFGIDREKKRDAQWQTWTDRHMTIDISEPGYKFHMNDIAATLGIVGLSHSDSLLAYRSSLVGIYRKHLGNLVQLNYGGSCWLMGILTRDRDALARNLQEHGIETDMVHLRNDIYKVFGGKRQNLPGMDEIECRYLYLPLHQNLQEQDILRVCTCVSRFLQQ